MDRLTDALSKAIAAAPCSLSALARAAGVSHVHLVHITQGKRRATSAVAEKVVRALEAWGDACHGEARRIRRALPPRRNS